MVKPYAARGRRRKVVVVSQLKIVVLMLGLVSCIIIFAHNEWHNYLLAINNNINDAIFFSIDKDSPTASEIRQLLVNERQNVIITKPMDNVADGYDYFKDMSEIYELTYAFVAEFQALGIPIFLAFGSHLGAQRHHGIIPFGEKDVDFAIFSLNHTQIKDTINKVLQERGRDTAQINKANFGYHAKVQNLSHYYDFWMFRELDNQVQCIGFDPKECGSVCAKNNILPGCSDWYHRFKGGAMAPLFTYEQWFPPRYQVFGTHKVPVPNSNRDLDIQYKEGGPWDIYCGGGQKNSERLCSKKYEDYPFVFSSARLEELRQGSNVLHQSFIASPLTSSTLVYAKKK